MSRREPAILKPLCLLLPLALALALSSGVAHGQAAAKSPAIITVDPLTAYRVNGVGELQAINGAVVNGESRMEHVAETRLLNFSTTRLYLWVDVHDIPYHWFDEIPKKTGLTREAAMDKWNATDFEKAVPEYFDRCLGIDPATGQALPNKGKATQFWQLEQLQAWGARSNVVLQITNPQPRDEKDFPAYERFYTATVREVKRRFPDLGPLLVMIYNEPDYEYPRSWESRGQTDSVAFFYRFYNDIDAAMKQAFPDVTLIGPGISQFMGWSDWKNWTVPFLKQVPQARYFNCQPYCWRFTDLLAWTEMLQAESLQLNGKRLPLVTTETNVELQQPAAAWWKDEYHAQRVSHEAAALFGMLAQPDQFAMKHFFFYHYACHWHDMWFRHDGVTEPGPVYWLYWIMRDVHGSMVLNAVNREDSPLKIISARDGQELAVAVFNDSDAPASASLQVLRPETLGELKASEFLRYDPVAKKFLHGAETLTALPEHLSFAPGEIRKLRWACLPAAKQEMPAVEETEFFAHDTAAAVEGAERQVQITARKAGAEEIVRLRLSFYLDDTLSVDRLGWSLNGHEMEVKYAPAFASDKVQPIVSVDCAVPNEWVAKTNTIVCRPVSGTSYRLMFASLLFRPQPKAFPAYVRTDALLRQPLPIDIAMSLPRTVAPGEVVLALHARNNTDGLLKAGIGLTLPEGWTLKTPLEDRDLPAQSVAELAARLLIPAGGLRGERFVAARLSVPGRAGVAARCGTVYQIPFQAESTAAPVAIDGHLDEWNPAAFVTTEHKGPGIASFTSRLAAKWDARAIYLALDVQGRALDPVPAGAHPWEHDTFEIFFDFWNAKKPQRDHTCMQTWIALKDLAAGQPTWQNMANDPNGVFLKGASPASYRVKVVERADGFSMEAALDWDALTASPWLPANERFVPKPGLLLGCEATLASRSLLGAPAKAYATPSKWGELKLLASGEQASMPNVPIRFDSSPTAAAADATLPLFRFDSSHTQDWAFPATAVLDEAGLHLENNGSVLLLQNPLGNVMSEKGVDLSLALTGFEAKGNGQEKSRTQARIFLTPQNLQGFIEPWGMTDMVCLVVESAAGRDVSLQLYAKAAPGQGWGANLWTGTMPADGFPVTLNLRLNAGEYRVRCDRHPITTSGSLSGYHRLPQDRWAGQVRFGVKSCYASGPGTVIIRRIDIRGAEGSPAPPETGKPVVNLLKATDSFEASVWQAFSAKTTVARNAATSPSGEQDACRLTSAGYHGQIIGTAIPGHTYVFSTWMKSATGVAQKIALFGENNPPAAAGASRTFNVTSAWQRDHLVFKCPDGGNSNFRFSYRAGDVFVWHPQVEDVTDRPSQEPGDYVAVPSRSRPARVPVKGPPPAGVWQNIACWGDSLTQGAGGKSYPSFLQEASLVEKRAVYSGGVGGEPSSKIKDRFLAAPEKFGDIAIIWVGRNNFQDPEAVKGDIAAMVAKLTTDRFLVLSIINMSTETKDTAAHATIQQLNQDLAIQYPDHFLDIRAVLVNAYDKTAPQDATDHEADVPPASLRSDKIHLNSAGYRLVADQILKAFQTKKWSAAP